MVKVLDTATGVTMWFRSGERSEVSRLLRSMAVFGGVMAGRAIEEGVGMEGAEGEVGEEEGVGKKEEEGTGKGKKKKKKGKR